MSRQALFNEIALGVSERYRHFLENLQSAYNRTILTADLTPRSLKTFHKDVLNVQKQYLEHEVENLQAVASKLEEVVSIDTANLKVNVLTDEDWFQYLNENTKFLFEAIKIQSSKDIIYINNFLRSKVLQLISSNDYQKAYNLVFNSKELSFFYTDKIGRKINSIKYVRVVVRDYMVKNYNDLIVGAAILNGIEEVVIENVDKNHEHHGKTIAATGYNSVNYFDVRDEIFHPNSNSIVKVG